MPSRSWSRLPVIERDRRKAELTRQLGLRGAGSERIRRSINDLDTAVLASVGIDPDRIRLEPEGNEWMRKKGHIPFNRAARAVLKDSLREAVARKHRRIGCEHILAALTTTSTADPARAILAGPRIDVSALRRDLGVEI